jgi:membrane-associated phospholipid phosphatase
MDPPPWRRDVAARVRALWRLKLAGIPAFMALFFTGYFFTLNHPRFPTARMPWTAADRVIGFHPAAIGFYLSLWVYVLLVPALIADRSVLRRYAVAASVLALAGLAIFFFWPTAVPNPGIDWARYPAFIALKAIDASGNACPSLHVAFAVFSAFWLARLLRQMGDRGVCRTLSWCWCLGILYSTLATKQHVAVDLAAGAMLGGLLALPGGGSFCEVPGSGN